MRLNIPECFAPFADGVFPTPSGKCELYSERMKADWPGPAADLHPAPRRPADAPRPGGALSVAAPQPAPAAVPQLDVRQFAPPSHRGRRSDDRAFGRRCSDSWLECGPVGRGLQRPRPVSGPGRRSPRACAPAWPSPPASTGTSSRPGAGNVNSTTSSALTDMGGGATFFDNMVEVRAASSLPER